MPEMQTALKRQARIKHKHNAWIIARKLSQIVALIAFIVLFVKAGQPARPGDATSLFVRLDPLAMLAHLLASKTFLAGSAIALAVVILTLVFGRAWCGWLCPLGTILDYVPLTRLRTKRFTFPDSWRSGKTILLITILVLALAGNLTLLALDPLTLFSRTLASSVWPLLERLVTLAETVSYRISGSSRAVADFDRWVRPLILPAHELALRAALMFTTLFLAVIALNVLAPRFWCRALCPLGGLLGLLSKFALIRRDVGHGCKGCTLCCAVCSTGTIDPKRDYASDPAECTMCMDCLGACPRGQVKFRVNAPVPLWQAYDPHRRQALLSFGAAVGGIALWRAEGSLLTTQRYLLRPPGFSENNLDTLAASNCIRCGLCMRVCPTNALHPAMLEAGSQGFASPLFIPRLGYCDYACNACGTACPVQAIPPLSLPEKRLQVIGRAVIDQQRCLPWAENTDCIVCEEMCPLPEKAIWLEECEVLTEARGLVNIKLPHLDNAHCIGCGICEYKCPVDGQAAIRITALEV